MKRRYSFLISLLLMTVLFVVRPMSLAAASIPTTWWVKAPIRTVVPKPACPQRCATSRTVTAGGITYTIEHGMLFAGKNADVLKKVPGAPSGSDLLPYIAAPALYPKIVVIATTTGAVYRQDQQGKWQLALQLLPNFPSLRPPPITGLTSFDEPVSGAIYLSTTAYGTFVSPDGGATWYRASSGLPGSVESLSTNAHAHAIYAITSQGIYVHHLEVFPSPAALGNHAPVPFWLGMGIDLAIGVLAGWVALAMFPWEKTDAVIVNEHVSTDGMRQ